jgi:hypothetical protein
MRRVAIIGLFAAAFAGPAAAPALGAATGDGTLVVKGGSAPRTIAVVTLSINGTTIGHVSTGSPDEVDTVVIYDPNNTDNIGASAMNGTLLSRTSKPGEQKTTLVGSDFRFRAAGGVYKIWVYGSGIDLFAVGNGRVTLQGQSDGSPDGKYSINGGAFHSLPGVPSDLLTIASAPGANG